MEEKYGLDKPLGVQYITYMKDSWRTEISTFTEKERPYGKSDHC